MFVFPTSYKTGCGSKLYQDTHSGGIDKASDSFAAILENICKECFVLGAHAEVAFADGAVANLTNGIYSHHIIINTVGKHHTPNPVNVKCNGVTTSGFDRPGLSKGASSMLTASRPAPFVVNGGDGSMVRFATRKGNNVKTGYFVPKNTSMSMSMEIVNYDDVEKDVYLSLDYEYLPHRPDGYLDVSMGTINIDGCPGIAFRASIHRHDYASKYLI